MKKIFKGITTLFACLAFAVPVWAVDTFTGNTAADWTYIASGIAKMTISWIDDGANGVSGTVYIPTSLYGYRFYYAVTDPGATAPTDNYDITLTKASGEEVFDSTLLNRDTANTETAWPTGYHIADENLTFTITDASQDVEDAIGTLIIYMIYPTR